MSKALVLFFSVYGSTRWVAAEVAKQTGADLKEIEPAVPYESDYDALSRRAQRELELDLRPGIRDPLRIDGYDLIFLGYPIWCFTVPMILRTFLEQYDLTGKTVVPFNTHLGSRDSGTWQLIRRLIPGALVQEGFSVEMNDVTEKAQTAVSQRLTTLQMTGFSHIPSSCRRQSR